MIRRRLALHSAALVLLSACGTLPGQEPVRVQVVDLEPASDGESLELRFICVLRVQNPNDSEIPFRGISVDLQVRGSAFASGVSDVSGTVPAFGEVLVRVPVSASALNIARMAIGLFMGEEERPKVDYVMHGRVGGIRFESRGEMNLPKGLGGRSTTSG